MSKLVLTAGAGKEDDLPWFQIWVLFHRTIIILSQSHRYPEGDLPYTVHNTHFQFY